MSKQDKADAADRAAYGKAIKPMFFALGKILDPAVDAENELDYVRNIAVGISAVITVTQAHISFAVKTGILSKEISDEAYKQLDAVEASVARGIHDNIMVKLDAGETRH